MNPTMFVTRVHDTNHLRLPLRFNDYDIAGNTPRIEKNTVLSTNLDRFTFHGSDIRTFREVCVTMACLPLNLAFAVSFNAGRQGIKGYEAGSLRQISSLLNKPDYRKIVDQAALTTNSYWRHLSNSPITNMADEYDELATIPIVQDDVTGDMVFSDPFLRMLRNRLSEANKSGRNDTGIEFRPSSGCPARHLLPHFNKSEKDIHALQELTHLFGASAVELTARRERTAINVGLDYLAKLIDYSAAIQDELTIAPSPAVL